MGSPNELSFLPDDYLEKKARRRANAVCGGLAVIVLGVIASTFMYTERAMREVQKRRQAVDTVYTEAARRIEQAHQMRAQQAQVVRRAELAATLLEKVPRSNVLAEFTNKMPAGVSLLDLALESRERAKPAPTGQSAFEQKRAALEGRVIAAAPEPTLYDVTIKLTGIATTDVQVAEFIRRLNGSALVRDVNLVISDTHEYQGAPLRRFQIEMMLNPDAEVRPAPPPVRATAAADVEEAAK